MFRLPCVHLWDFCTFIFRLLCVHVQTTHVQIPVPVRWSLWVHAKTFVGVLDLPWCSSSDFRVFMFRFSWIHQTFVISSDFRAFMFTLLFVYVQFSVHSTDFCAFMFKFLCIYVHFLCAHQTFVIRSYYVHVKIFLSSCPDLLAFNRLMRVMFRPSCVHASYSHQTFARSPDLWPFMFRLPCFLAFFGASTLCNFEPTLSWVHICSGHTCFSWWPQPEKSKCHSRWFVSL